MEERFDALTEALLEKEYWILDLLPGRVSAERADAWFAAERFFLEEPRLRALYERFAALLVKLSCYYDPALCAEGSWTEKPDPRQIRDRVTACAERGWCNLLLPEEESLITLNGGDLYMTLYHPHEELRETVAVLAASEGLFLRKGE